MPSNRSQQVASSDNRIGKVSQDVVVKDFTITADTSIYADNDVLSISAELTNVARVAGGCVELVSAVLFDGDDQGTEVEVFFTTNSTTPGTINAALSAADTVYDDIVGRLHFITFNDLIGSQNAVLPLAAPINQIMKCASDTTSLYIFSVVRSGTPTYTAAGLKLKLAFRQF